MKRGKDVSERNRKASDSVRKRSFSPLEPSVSSLSAPSVSRR